MNRTTGHKTGSVHGTGTRLVALLAILVLACSMLAACSGTAPAPAAPAVTESAPAESAAPLETAAPEAEKDKYEGYRLKKDVETVLVAGVDKYEEDTDTESYNNTQQSDFMMLLVYDDAAKEVSAIHINRDIMTDVMVLGVRGEKIGYKTMQITLAHAYGSGGNDSCRNSVDAVSRLLNGVEIDHFIFLTMDAIPIINDLCGGITLELMADFSDINPAMKEGSTYTLMGQDALMYVRTRMTVNDGTNLARMKRQEQYLQALFEKMVSVPEDSDKMFILKLTNAVSEYMTSDCTVTQLDSLFDRGQSYKNTGFVDIDGDNVVGEKFMEFYPHQDSIDQIVRDEFYEKAS